MPAPIAIFAFNRPDHLRRTLKALAANDLAVESNLTIFCDGPRTEKEKKLTNSVRDLAAEARGFKSVQVVARERNMGCADSVIAGVNEIFLQHKQIVVIEDDILCSPYTLRFLNIGLKKYEHVPVVFNISAWSFPPSLLDIPQKYPYGAYFVPRCNIWGWASWRDRWEKIDWAVSDYINFARDKNQQKRFNQGGEDLSPMLKLQMKGKLDSWAIRMDYARFKHGRLSLNPVRSYTTNIGLGSGTHTTIASTRLDNDISRALPEPILPDHIFVDTNIARAYQKIYSPPSLPARAINKAWRMLFGKNFFDV